MRAESGGRTFESFRARHFAGVFASCGKLPDSMSALCPKSATDEAFHGTFAGKPPSALAASMLSPEAAQNVLLRVAVRGAGRPVWTTTLVQHLARLFLGADLRSYGRF